MDLRKATILCADVVGYCSLMAMDPAQTIGALLKTRRAVAMIVQRHGGRIVNAVGDCMLAELGSETEALHGALEIQRWLATQRLRARGSLSLRMRIGIHSGDVIALGGAVYGTTVNVASRLQAVAEPDGILISSVRSGELALHEPFSAREAGPFALKNIPERIFGLHLRAAP